MLVDYQLFQTEFEPELLALVNEISAEGIFFPFFRPLSAEEGKKLFSERTLCAFTDGELVGFSLIAPGSALPLRTSRAGRLLFGVKPDTRGCGVGRRLLELTAERAGQSGLTSLLAGDVPADDRVAIELLKSYGFRRVGRVEAGIERERGFCDSLLFQKTI